MAISLLRRLELGLRAPDAVNIAIAQRCAATLLTIDENGAIGAIARYDRYQLSGLECPEGDRMVAGRALLNISTSNRG
ncbi:MAG: hypothetical protein ACYDBZ_10125 [Steroidobacteraceae bacterium]